MPDPSYVASHKAAQKHESWAERRELIFEVLEIRKSEPDIQQEFPEKMIGAFDLKNDGSAPSSADPALLFLIIK